MVYPGLSWSLNPIALVTSAGSWPPTTLTMSFLPSGASTSTTESRPKHQRSRHEFNESLCVKPRSLYVWADIQPDMQPGTTRARVHPRSNRRMDDWEWGTIVAGLPGRRSGIGSGRRGVVFRRPQPRNTSRSSPSSGAPSQRQTVTCTAYQLVHFLSRAVLRVP